MVILNTVKVIQARQIIKSLYQHTHNLADPEIVLSTSSNGLQLRELVPVSGNLSRAGGHGKGKFMEVISIFTVAPIFIAGTRSEKLNTTPSFLVHDGAKEDVHLSPESTPLH